MIDMPENRISKRKHQWGTRGELLVAFQFILVATFIVLPDFPVLTHTELYARVAIFRWLLLVVTWVAALLLGAFGSMHIKEFLTPLPYPVDHNRLVTTGMYSLVRHPLYSSQLFLAFGWSIFSLSLSHLLLSVFGLLFFSYKASREEKWLTERHPEYADYALRVKRFIPWIY